jgi:hypothetical protein
MLREVPTHQENSMELIETLHSRDRTDNLKFHYTSIPIQEAIKNAIDRIKNITYFPTAEDLQGLLTISLNSTYFTLNSKIYLQIQSLPPTSAMWTICTNKP